MARALALSIMGLIAVGALSCDWSSRPVAGLISATDGGTVIGATGELIIAVPPGALAEDAVITISRVSEEDLYGAAVAAFDLGPDNIQFTEQIELSFSLPMSLFDGSLMAFLVDTSGDSDPHLAALPLALTDLQIDPEMGGIQGKVHLDHFSELWFVKGFHHVSIDAPESPVAGEPFTATVTVGYTGAGADRFKGTTSIGPDRHEYTDPGYRHLTSYFLTGEAWRLEGRLVISPNVDSDMVVNRPLLTLTQTSSIAFDQLVECADGGLAFSVIYLGEVSNHVLLRLDYSSTYDDPTVIADTRDIRFDADEFAGGVFARHNGTCLPSPPFHTLEVIATADVIQSASPTPELDDESGDGNIAVPGGVPTTTTHDDGGTEERTGPEYAAQSDIRRSIAFDPISGRCAGFTETVSISVESVGLIIFTYGDSTSIGYLGTDGAFRAASARPSATYKGLLDLATGEIAGTFSDDSECTYEFVTLIPVGVGKVTR